MKNIFLFTFLFLYSFGFKLEQEFNIKTYQVKELQINDTKEYYGKIVANQNNIYDGVLRFSGFVTKRYITEPFSYVKKGDKLFDIYSSEIYNLFDELKIAKKNEAHLQKNIKKKFELFNIQIKDINKDSITIRAQKDGYLTLYAIKENSFIKSGQKAFEIIDTSSLWFIANLYQTDFSFIDKSLQAKITLDGVEKDIEAKFEKFYTILDEKSQTIQVQFYIQNNNNLPLGMFGKVTLKKQQKSAIFIPKTCVVSRENKKYVFIKSGKTYEPLEVQVTATQDGYIVKEGVSIGDIIAQNVLFLLDSDAVTNGLYSNDW